MKRNDYRFLDRLRVRWAEIDAQKIVFNAHYLMYFDTAIAGYWRAMAMPYAQTMEYLGGDLFVRKATVEYHGSARYDDVLVSCELVYVFADPQAQTSRPVPQQLRDLLQAFEAGKPMVEVRTGSWDTLGAQAGAIRTEVFVDEQKIPADLEWDSADAGSLHAVAYNRFGAALGTGRLLEHVPGVAKIGRMAVRQSVRGSGVGRAVLDALVGAARQRGDREAILHAQLSAAPFYVRAGFNARGPAFEEAGIPHVEMVRSL